ncbi:hypothetical protein H7Q97_10735 [Ochrobactrum sp. CM-21-5]|nr:hypothetical protein [Ochrobactrum sp. CM-21-5]MBC2885870.1 hypothetical protein [Ochrobactrum sp. CM-21-5]
MAENGAVLRAEPKVDWTSIAVSRRQNRSLLPYPVGGQEFLFTEIALRVEICHDGADH